MFKKLALKILGSTALKGGLTYGGIAVTVLPVIAKALGLDVGGDEVTAIISGIGAVVAIIGRARAGHQAA